MGHFHYGFIYYNYQNRLVFTAVLPITIQKELPLRINYHFEQEVVHLAIALSGDQAIQVPQPMADAPPAPAPEVNPDISVAPGAQQEVTIFSFLFYLSLCPLFVLLFHGNTFCC